MPPNPVKQPEDPVYLNSLKDARFGMIFWTITTVLVCSLSYFLGYQRIGHQLTAADVQPIFGMPRWFFIAVIVPWIVCSVICVVYAGFIMSDEDLGTDHTEELEQEIREGTDIHELV